MRYDGVGTLMQQLNIHNTPAIQKAARASLPAGRCLRRNTQYTPPTKGFVSTLPVSWVPYAQLMRIERPAGLYAFYVPYILGLAFAACLSKETIQPSILLKHSGLLLVGCVILRGASCTWNDNMDQEYDRAVARCRNRPIARRAVSTAQGHIFTLALYLAGAGLVSIWPKECAYDAIVIAILFTIYPFGKRFTNYPQFILGFPFAAGIVFSCHLVGVDPFAGGVMGLSTAFLMAANVSWTMIYDTIYAHQDLKDDLKAGVKSMAVRFKDSTKTLTSVLAILQVLLLVKVGADLELSSLYYIITCAGTAVALAAMISLVDLEVPASCAWWFKMDFWFAGGTMIGGFLAQYLQRVFL
ncbi:putative 4-hydroxybenzoate polyprenyl transferase [Paraphaeosphaeria sporulosa]|uniref:Putative 4-hydroxybenzoate polyprenyl transferase n=1 Tax=Paraphaeosphaeria sporulosa TaxID=1460663 RepID=A0A177C1L7_9PLEO|nr:putative 4-hydroxybenzoate polyprenyl transferase [Paraphaeosphaeria sporulosa]OAG00769.1 putative 4-hydroxybenzoate polyprenyl transferase [Paraphaeosphaeria sporulosa]